jgi:hypothetical protein
MNRLDLLVLSAIAVVAAYPLVRTAASRAVQAFRRQGSVSPDSVEKWRQKWTSLLITLGREIEGGSGSLTRQDEALRLSRELMWEIIGGEITSSAKK